MSDQKKYKIGTLIKDTGKIGVIYRLIESGTLTTPYATMNWRYNYEVYYFDGTVTVMGQATIDRLIETGVMEIIEPEDYDGLFKG